MGDGLREGGSAEGDQWEEKEEGEHGWGRVYGEEASHGQQRSPGSSEPSLQSQKSSFTWSQGMDSLAPVWQVKRPLQQNTSSCAGATPLLHLSPPLLLM